MKSLLTKMRVSGCRTHNISRVRNLKPVSVTFPFRNFSKCPKDRAAGVRDALIKYARHLFDIVDDVIPGSDKDAKKIWCSVHLLGIMEMYDDKIPYIGLVCDTELINHMQKVIVDEVWNALSEEK
jgi:hypothetical protein